MSSDASRLDTAAAVAARLGENANPEQAARLQRYFKTGPGEYGAGDVFIGLKVPQVRAVARQARWLPLAEVSTLIQSEVHEHRLCALLILVGQYQRQSAPGVKALIFDAYLDFLKAGRVNNWDLIDTSAPYLGAELVGRPEASVLLDGFASSSSLWERRFAIMASWAFLRVGDGSHTLRLAVTLLGDHHDLIHKAAGWMLRELGKTQPGQLREFLESHVKQMPRTMLRYAIEKFPEAERQLWLSR